MKVIIEDNDWIEATKPAFNGCKYRLFFKADGRVMIDIGCYHLVFLQWGFNKYLQGQIPEGGLEIKCSPELKNRFLTLPNCPRCHAPLHEPRQRLEPLASSQTVDK